MADRRTVDELSIEELEEILLLKRRQARQERLRRLAEVGRVADDLPLPLEKHTWHLPVKRKAHSRFRSVEVAEGTGEKEKLRMEPKQKSPLARWRDRILLILEVASLAGLMLILAGSLLNLRLLNEEMAQAREAPPPTPTPLINVSILPGGHAPPGSGGEIPEHLRNIVQPLPAIPIPTPGPRAPTRIVIPAIGVDSVVVEGDDPEALKRGVGHHIGSANPGERGNCFLSGHNDIFGEVFKDLDKLELEDEVIVYAGDQPYRYNVKAKRIVEPTDVSVLYPTTKPVLTLMTCYPYLIDTHRLVIISEMRE